MDVKVEGIITDELNNCGSLPRYACYYENRAWKLSTVSDRRLIIHSSWTEEHQKYNLTSCYFKNMPRQPFTEFRDKAAETIRGKAAENSIVFCSKKNWGLK